MVSSVSNISPSNLISLPPLATPSTLIPDPSDFQKFLSLKYNILGGEVLLQKVLQSIKSVAETGKPIEDFVGLMAKLPIIICEALKQSDYIQQDSHLTDLQTLGTAKELAIHAVYMFLQEINQAAAVPTSQASISLLLATINTQTPICQNTRKQEQAVPSPVFDFIPNIASTSVVITDPKISIENMAQAMVDLVMQGAELQTQLGSSIEIMCKALEDGFQVEKDFVILFVQMITVYHELNNILKSLQSQRKDLHSATASQKAEVMQIAAPKIIDFIIQRTNIPINEEGLRLIKYFLPDSIHLMIYVLNTPKFVAFRKDIKEKTSKCFSKAHCTVL